MECGFDFKIYGTVFKDCFINYSMYDNGKMKLSLFGSEKGEEDTSHFADITLDSKKLRLSQDEIVVDNKFKTDFVPQLIKLGIIKEMVSVCKIGGTEYPIHKVNFPILFKNCYYPDALLAA